MIRIATVFSKNISSHFKACTMETVRWLRISEALARLGFKVDMIVNDGRSIVQKNQYLRFVSCHRARWQQYDIIKTLFHEGFQFLIQNKLDMHPFIISKLGSVVGKQDNTDGVYFFGNVHEELYEVQQKIAQRSRYVTVLTEESKSLWKREFNQENNILLVPTGVDRKIPPASHNPYSAFKEKIAVFIGNIYNRLTQRQVNLNWQHRLNILGKLLKKRGIRLCFIGRGEIDKLDTDQVTYLGPVENDSIWDYQYFADVGLVLAQGRIQHNESSKIYYYLRTGLPVVCEEPVPNSRIIQEANLGFIAKYGDYESMANMVEEAIYREWDEQTSIKYILRHHTWDIRVQRYYEIISEKFL